MVAALLMIVVHILPVIIFMAGILGNLMTIISTYFAKWKRRYGFDKNWRTSTVYIQNLAIINFMYCFLKLFQKSYEIQMHLTRFANSTIGGDNMEYEEDSSFCDIFAHLQIFLGNCDKWAIVVIALIRSFAITNNRKWETICERKRNVCSIVVCPWLLGGIGEFFGIKETYTRNENTGVCILKNVNPEIAFKYIIRFSLQSLIIISSYIYIYCYVAKQSRSKESLHARFGQEQSNISRSRNIGLAKTMSMIGFSSIFLSLPMMFVFILFLIDKIDSNSYSLLGLICYNIMILQYSNNLFIYVWRKDEHMHAILDLLSWMFPFCFRKSHHRKSEEGMKDSTKIFSSIKKENDQFVCQIQSDNQTKIDRQ